MSENPHEKEDLSEPGEKPLEEPTNADEKGTWSEDQRRRSYYYDDASGYQVYDAECDEEDED